MSVNVRGLENAGYHMTVRAIGNAYLKQRSGFPMTDSEFREAREYAAMKMDVDQYTVFENDEQRYVYYGRLIGELVAQSRMDVSINGRTDDAGSIEKEPGAYAEPLMHFYSTAVVPKMQ